MSEAAVGRRSLLMSPRSKGCAAITSCTRRLRSSRWEPATESLRRACRILPRASAAALVASGRRCIFRSRSNEVGVDAVGTFHALPKRIGDGPQAHGRLPGCLARKLVCWSGRGKHSMVRPSVPVKGRIRKPVAARAALSGGAAARARTRSRGTTADSGRPWSMGEYAQKSIKAGVCCLGAATGALARGGRVLPLDWGRLE